MTHQEPQAVYYAACSEVQRLYYGGAPNGHHPEMFGTWHANVIEPLYTAYQEGGTQGVQDQFDLLLKFEPTLVKLLTDTPPIRQLLHATELSQLPKSRWLIDNMLPAAKLAQIFGPGGIGKSYLNLDIALSIAQFANVVYIAAEDAEDYADRTEAWCYHHKRKPDGLYFWTEPLNLFNQDVLDTFLAKVQPLKPALIIIDPLANCMVGKEENTTGDMNMAVDALNRIRRHTQASILICHHTGWNETHERGSSVLRAACRIVMRLSSTDDGLTLSCEKINGAKRFEPRKFRMVETEKGVVLLPAQHVAMDTARISPNMRMVLEALIMVQFKDGASHTQLTEATNLAKSTLHRTIDRLLEVGYVESDGPKTRRTFAITQTGRDIIHNTEQAAHAGTVYLEQDAEQSLNWRVNKTVVPRQIVPQNT